MIYYINVVRIYYIYLADSFRIEILLDKYLLSIGETKLKIEFHFNDTSGFRFVRYIQI